MTIQRTEKSSWHPLNLMVMHCVGGITLFVPGGRWRAAYCYMDNYESSDEGQICSTQLHSFSL